MAKQTKHETNRKMKTTKELIIADITAKVEAKLASQKVELSLGQDLMTAEENLKDALLSFGKVKDQYEKSKANFNSEADKAFKIALKYNAASNELGLKAIDNVFFKAIDTYLASPLYKNLNK